MLVKKSKKKTNPVVRLNVPIEVEGFEDVTTKDGEVLRAVVGTDMVSKEKVSVVLTNRGNDADNARRKSIEDYENGYKFGKEFLQLLPGGIVSIKSAFPMSDSKSASGAKILMGHWANVLAYTDKAAFRESAPPALQASKNYPIVALARGKVYYKKDENGESQFNGGSVHLYVTDSCYNGPLNGITEGMEIPAKMVDKIENKESSSGIGFMVRILDEDGRVLEAVENFQRWDDEEERPLTAGERTAVLANVAGELARGLEDPAASVSITPVFAYPMSFKSDPMSFFNTHRACSNYLGKVDGDPCYEGKVHKCAIQFSDTTENGRIYINHIYPYSSSSKEGLSLALFDGREYAPSYQAKIDAIVESNDDPSEDDRGPSPA